MAGGSNLRDDDVHTQVINVGSADAHRDVPPCLPPCTTIWRDREWEWFWGQLSQASTPSSQAVMRSAASGSRRVSWSL